MEEIESWLALARAPGLHAGLLPRMETGRPVEALGLLRESRSTLAALGLGDAAIEAIRRPDRNAVDRDLKWLQGEKRQLVSWGSRDYPALLAEIVDAPLVLFVEGDPAVLGLPQLAMVGSRNPTSIGRETATSFAAHLAAAGLVITSGLALGIDAAGHRGALQAGGQSVAVLGCGLDRIYPRENTELGRRVAASGALVSEHPTGAPPLPQNFPRRNRLISGLSVGTLVVEAALRSGSLITARLAAEQGREVFAIPGSIHSPLSRGCHRLLRHGAKLVESADDIFSELEALVRGLAANVALKAPDEEEDSRPALDKDYEILLDALGFEAASIETLIARTGFKTDAISSMLLILELDELVEQQPGGIYCRRLPRN